MRRSRPVYRDRTSPPTKPVREGDERSLLDAILAEPDDDAPRLVYADWLAERGDPRGEFIIVQLELAKLGPTDRGDRVAELHEREVELLRLHKKTWVGRFGGKRIEHGSTERTWTRTNPTKWKFERGFVAWCSMNSEDFARNASALFEAEPVRRVHLTDCGVEQLARIDGIGRLRELDLRRVRLKSTIDDLVAATWFTGLEVLGLEMCGLGVKATRTLAAGAQSKRLPRLRALELGDNGLGDAGARLLAEAPILRQIRRLDLSRNEIGSDGARALAASPHLDALEYLDVFGNELGAGRALLSKRFGSRLAGS
jgi:uncharacterized protein (TIGR02996 family)